jgi:hypothetical protein
MNDLAITIPEDRTDVNVMMFGNNPAEMSVFLTSLSDFAEAKFITNFYFNLRYRSLRINEAMPEYIVIDDCYPVDQISKFIRKVRRNFKTHSIPVAILKTKNTPILINDVQDYLLKESLTPERLLHAVRNSRNIRMTQIILYKTYKRSKKHYSKLMTSIGEWLRSL